MIPISVVKLDEEAERLAVEVIRSGRLAQGPKVQQLEEEFGKLQGVKNVVAVNNGTTALVAAIQALDLKPGDEVVTSPFTFVATLNAILEAGATARFVDISADDFCLDPAGLEAAITERTKVVMPVHLYGQAADMSRIMPVVERHGLHLVEDAAQAHGATFDGRGVGGFGTGCFSLYGTKNITTGEGGLITTNDDAVADKLRVMRNQGMRAQYQYEMAGHNYRLTDLQAALALPQLGRYEDVVSARKRNAARLSEGLAGVPGLRTPAELPGRSHVWHQYTILLDGTAKLSRDELRAALMEKGVGCGVYYPKVVYDYGPYLDNPRVIPTATPVTDTVVRGCLSLPVHHHLTDDDVDTVIGAVRELLGA